MPFALYYPDEASPTASWTPASDPVSGSSDERISGFLTVQMADNSFRNYQIAPARRRWKRRFEQVSDADKQAYEAFLAAVGAAEIKLSDPILPAVVSGYLVGTGLEPVFTPRPVGTWDFEIEILEA